MPSTNTRFSPKKSITSVTTSLILFIFLNTSPYLLAQRPLYQIIDTLLPSGTELSGTINIAYTNNSNVKLEKLGIHLWPNAYKEKNTALVNQKLNQNDLTLFRARNDERGGLYDLNFSSPDQNVQLILDAHHIDIGWLQLSEPLLP